MFKKLLSDENILYFIPRHHSAMLPTTLRWDWGIFILILNTCLGYTCSWSQTVQVADMAIALHRFKPFAQSSSDSLWVTLSRGAEKSDNLRVYQRRCEISSSLQYFWDTMLLFAHQFKNCYKPLPLLLIFDIWKKNSRCLSQRYLVFRTMNQYWTQMQWLFPY